MLPACLLCTYLGVIVTFGVSVDREAARQAQATNVRVLAFDRLQDAIAAVTQRSGPIAALRTTMRPRVKNNMKE
jgi:translation initiation factor IF-2